MWNKLRIYTVHVKPDESDNVERLRFVAEGFNFWAFAFMLFWALYNQMWRFAGIIFVLLVCLWSAIYAFDWLFDPSRFFMQLGIQLWVGFHANDYLRAKLKREGFVTYALVSGENEMRAEQRFLDQNHQFLKA